MTEQDKQLLLKDLCVRLPYGVILNVDNGKYRENKKIWPGLFNSDNLWDAKPYLRPMSSMTNKERRFLLKYGTVGMDENDKVFDVYPYGMERNMAVIDFLNEHHFDYRGLIPMGLALEAPEGMYKTE